MRHWPTQSLAVDGAALQIYRSTSAPTGRRSVLLVHGFTDNAMYWSRLAIALAELYDVYAYDARGHGSSSRLVGRWDDDVRAGDLLRVVEALDLHKPYAIGHSMGGSTVSNAAAARPDVFGALVLEDPAWWEISHLPTEQQAAIGAAMQQRRADWRSRIVQMKTIDEADSLEMVHADNPDWSRDDQILSRDARLQVDPAAFDHYPTTEAPWKHAVAAWRCPALLVLGSRGNAIITPSLAATVQTINPSVRWVQIADAAHSIRFAQFDAYYEAVAGFLSSAVSPVGL